MKGKRLVHNQHLHPAPLQRTTHRHPTKRKLQQVRSLELKAKGHQHPPLQKIIKIPQQPSLNDYQWERRQRQTLNYVPIEDSPTQSSPSYEQSRFRPQRNTISTDHFPRQHHLIANSSQHSINSSQPRIKIFSTENKDKSYSRSDNSSAKKRGIGITKTLLKRISGMYNDKDFDGKISYIKSNRDSTGIRTSNNIKGKVNEEYQLNDSDFHISNNNRTFNISSSNPLSFNDSGNWHKTSQSASRDFLNQNDFRNPQESTSGAYSQQNHPGIYNQSRQFGTDKIHKLSGTTASKQSNTLRRSKQSGISSGYWQNKVGSDTWGKKSSKIITQSSVYRSKDRQTMMTSQSPRKQLTPVRSYNLLTTQRPISQSIQIEMDTHLSQSRHSNHMQDSLNSRYVIQSKNRTLDQLSVKQSMVIGFDNYYQ